MTASNTKTLSLTALELVALSVALKTTLRIWGSSEDKAQERVRGKLQSVVNKLDSLATTNTDDSAASQIRGEQPLPFRLRTSRSLSAALAARD